MGDGFLIADVRAKYDRHNIRLLSHLVSRFVFDSRWSARGLIRKISMTSHIVPTGALVAAETKGSIVPGVGRFK